MSYFAKYTLCLFLIFCLSFGGLLLINTKVNAAVPNCRFTGITNIYAAPGAEIDYATENTYRDHRCSVRGMRIDKVVFNTIQEKRDLVPYVRDVTDRTGHPIAICWNGDRGKMLALSWFWASSIHRLNKQERLKYVPWLSSQDGCKVYHRKEGI